MGDMVYEPPNSARGATSIHIATQAMSMVKLTRSPKEKAQTMPAKKTRSKPGPKKTSVSKSDFIRQQPANLSGPEVVKKAKAAGLKLSSQLVYVVRAKMAKAKAKTPTKATSTSAPKPTTSKAAFVRGLPATIPAKVVVAQAKAAGMKLSSNYVYLIRRAAKENRGSVRAGRSVPRPIGTAASAESLLKALAAELGLGPAIEILQAERARVRAVIGE
jgi:hypothetical protein